MRPGHGSQTAVMVCMARAAAHGRSPVARYADPTAIELLPDDARQQVERARAGGRPVSLREGILRGMIDARVQMMVARTVAIDDAVRAAPGPQVVILGAGLDGRAWRMPELASAIVFEVDHPDSQRDKRARASRLTPTAREIRFVPVDFSRDDLSRALADAGHEPAQPTTWIWEGVVMYLTRAQVEATLAVIDRRTRAGGRVIVAYASRSWILPLIGLLLRRVGEPLRSLFSPEQMRSLLAHHRFTVVADRDVPAIASGLSADMGRVTRRLKHWRIATADRRDRHTP